VGCVTVLPSWRHNPEYCLEKWNHQALVNRAVQVEQMF
jgi:hypothetical protein